MHLPARFVTTSVWAFIPGPTDQSQPTDSQLVQDIVELPAGEVAASFLAFPGMCLVHPAQPDWWAWQARWESAADHLTVSFTLFEHLEPPHEVWGGSPITADCPSDVLLALLQHLNQRHAGIWLHDPDCGMHAFNHLDTRHA